MPMNMTIQFIDIFFIISEIILRIDTLMKYHCAQLLLV